MEMFMEFTLILLTICLQRACCQCSGTTLYVQLQLLNKEYITSPNFQSGNYSQNLTCAWTVESSSNLSTIFFRVRYLGMVDTQDKLKIYKGTNNTDTVIVDTTDNTSNDRKVVETVNERLLYITFTTDDDPLNDGEGFEMYILESQDLSGTVCTETIYIEASFTEQYITSPNFPSNYNTSIECNWNISSSDCTEIVVSIVYMDVETKASSACFDSVQIGDSGELCANQDWNKNLTFRFNNSVLVYFKSDDEQVKQGFVVSYIQQEYPGHQSPDNGITTSTPKTTNEKISSTFNALSQELSTASTVDRTSKTDRSEYSPNSTPSSRFTSSESAIISTTVYLTNSTTEHNENTLSTTEGPSLETSAQTHVTTVSQFETSEYISTTDSSTEYQTTTDTMVTTSESTTEYITQQSTSQSQTPSKVSSIISTTDGTITTAYSTRESIAQSQSSIQSSTTSQNNVKLTTVNTEFVSSASSTQPDTTDDKSITSQSRPSSSEELTTYMETAKVSEKHTSSNNQDTSMSVGSTTTKQGTVEEQELSPEAQGGIIAGAVIGVASVGVLLGLITYLLLKSKGTTISKSVSGSRETTQTQITDEGLPKWIEMLDTMKKSPYNPTYLTIETT